MIAEVQRAIFVTPPRMTIAVSTAMTAPISHWLPERNSLPVEEATIAATWLDWKRLPAPKTPTRVKIA